MKKILCSMFLVMLIIFGVADCLATEEPYLIYKNQDFEYQKVGEKPNAFDWHELGGDPDLELQQIYAAYNNVEVVTAEKDGNSENLAAKLNGYADPNGSYTALVRSLFNYYPIKNKGVISFSFKVDDFLTKKASHLNGNVNVARNVSYADSKQYFQFITIDGRDVYYNNDILIKKGISENTWYDIDFVVDVKGGRGTLYFDGVQKQVSLPPDIDNISELRFDLPKKENSAWYIDDLRIYEADSLVDDEVIDAAWKKYTDSSYYMGYEFESGRAANYDYMAFLKCYDKRFAIVGTNRVFDGSKTVQIPEKIHYQDGEIMVPVRAIGEMFGAKVAWDDAGKKVILTHNGNTMTISPDKDFYYINGKKVKLHYPMTLVNGSACMQIDVLLKFVEKKYTLDEDILWFDEPREFDWHMPLDADGNELWGTANTALDENIYRRIIRGVLYDKPTDAEVDEAIRTFSPENKHPRIELTAESVAKIKEARKTDQNLDNTVNALIKNAQKYAEAGIVTHSTSDGNRTSYTDPIKTYFNTMAFAYLMAETEEDKAFYKQGIWCQLEALDKFPDFHFQYNSALGTGTMCYGLAYAYDWVEWTDEERKIIEDMCRRNVFDHALRAYNSSVRDWSRDINYGQGNQAVITNGGILLLAISMYETDPEYFQDIIRGAIRATEGGTSVYFPDGEYPEGLSYWRYAGDFLPRVVKGLQTSMGQDFGMSDVPGVLETAKFPIMMKGAAGGHAFGDGEPEDAVISLFMFSADQSGNKALAEYRKQSMGLSGDTVDVANWVFDTSEYNQGLDVYETDIYAKNAFTVIMKTGWSKADTSVAFHGGANNDPHGHMDVGTVQFDMSGVRFGMDLPRENYNLRDRGYYVVTETSKYWPDGYDFKAEHYYRYKGEGHNTVVANRSVINTKMPDDPNSYDTKPNGTSEFIKVDFSDTSSFAVLNMTDTNDIFSAGIRGVRLDKINNILEIQDDFKAHNVTDFLWSMHTQADIEISEDGKSAILTQNNTKVKATILNDCDLKFVVMPAAFDETYGTTLKPPIETPNTVYKTTDEFYVKHKIGSDVGGKDIRKLAVKGMTDYFKLSVSFQPYIEGTTIAAEYLSVDQWKNTDIKRQNLASVMIDGEPLKTFSSDKYNYAVNVVTEKSDIPVIVGVAENADVDVEVIPSKTVPGVTNIVLTQNGVTAGLYSFAISPINDTTKFHSDKQLPIYAYTVSSEPETQHGVKNLFDGDFTSKFATDEQGGAVVMDLGNVIEGNLKLNVSFLEGDKRFEYLKIEYSEDGSNYHEVFNGSNSGTTTGLQQFDVAKKARYVKVSFYGSSQGAWVSVTEMFVSNE